MADKNMDELMYVASAMANVDRQKIENGEYSHDLFDIVEHHLKAELDGAPSVTYLNLPANDRRAVIHMVERATGDLFDPVIFSVGLDVGVAISAALMKLGRFPFEMK